ncbi:superoxide dismutase, Ni [Planctobacterium marinum]|uniref:superoxide dismutase, Ni n=1 Tax=Planctobacterium marinum TaxID=1631968 RepID=UPI001E462064|nr:superoxide dismutase, Ni [Planctobacterium marinum]MCC2608203.1 superoxide dismutase, Ni [Planctobacterium marinum]
MLYNTLDLIDKLCGFERVSAHCDIPCKVYDPAIAQFAALSVVRFLDLIGELSDKDSLSLDEQAKLTRLVQEKELHAAKVKDEVVVIWGDYFKEPQITAHPNVHQLVHSIMLAGSACKQSIQRDNGVKLLELVNQFAAMYWQTKSVETFITTSPYLPNEQVVYPRLD